ncbi:CopD family protein [Mucilaginibacter sp. 21P]|uniref:CopD family protein n=1 Tax=Mucilaginibacter sp. 21P TaxID=2778902 RepID=UPI001C570428|nr:CopD family protein [Mucilaginibacter sp. 21P]QXV66936.1 CopD family protein [Mucilaginibacter sp. 21P]
MYQYVLAIHIIFVVCWMAGLFYMVRLFIYHTEAQEKPEPARTILSEQFELMERKLWWIITTPSMYLVVIAGALMIHLHKWYMIWPRWLIIKLLFVVGLLVYHFICQNKMKAMASGKFTWTSTQLRLWNELATIILFAIVFLVVLKNSLNWIFGVIGIIAFSVILMITVKIYKRFRERK